jgi:Ca2+-binding EF-hand superfamily protein
MNRIEILSDLINAIGGLSKQENERILNEYETKNPNSIGITSFIKHYNSFTPKPIKEDQLNMFFRYYK